MRLMPQTLVSRTMWILFIGTVGVAIDISVMVQLTTEQDEQRVGIYETGLQAQTLINVFDNLLLRSRQTLLNKIQFANMKLTLFDDKPQYMLAGEGDAVDILRQQIIANNAMANVSVGFLPDDTANLLIVVALSDGQWLQFVMPYVSPDYQAIKQELIVLSMTLMSIVLIAYIIAQQVVKPLKQLAQLVTRFSTDITTPPIEVSGPVEIRQTAEAFNLMQVRIRRFVDERMQMVAAISHDLRTPITRLRLRVEQLTDASQRQKALNDLADMQSMITSTLAFIRDDSAKETAMKTDMAALVKSLCDDMADMGDQVEYIGPDHVVLLCKAVAMKRALTNLIDNAVKYGDRADVSLVVTPLQLTISIRDVGPGIPEDELQQVFTPFYRLDKSRNRNTGGTGLGLSVCRTIIQGHGGDLVLQNRLQGLCAIVRLPLEKQ